MELRQDFVHFSPLTVVDFSPLYAPFLLQFFWSFHAQLSSYLTQYRFCSATMSSFLAINYMNTTETSKWEIQYNRNTYIFFVCYLFVHSQYSSTAIVGHPCTFCNTKVVVPIHQDCCSCCCLPGSHNCANLVNCWTTFGKGFQTALLFSYMYHYFCTLHFHDEHKPVL